MAVAGPDRRYVLIVSAAVAVLAAWLVIRASTQSLTHDEALTYNDFVTRSWYGVFTTYYPNHHILHTVLVKLVTSVFGVSELTLRLPAILGGVLYAICSARLTARLLGRNVWAAVTLALLVLNPYVVDFLVASRGYALALAFFVWHIDELLLGRSIRASLLAGLAVCANVTFLFAVAATTLARLLLHRDRRFLANSVRLVLPGMAIFGAICGAAVSSARKDQFFIGTESLWEMASDLMTVSFRYGSRDYLPLALPALIVAGCAALAALFAKATPAAVPRFFALSSLLVIAELVAVHVATGLLYPTPRTGLYLVVLGTLLLSTGAAASERRLLLVPLFAIAIAYAAQLPTRSFYEWRYDAATARLFEQVLATTPPAGMRICADWPYEPTLNFYRGLRNAKMIEPIERDTFEQCDFALVNVRERFVGTRHDLLFARSPLREIARDHASGSVLYARVTR
jgi:hypothetical protein